MEKVYCPVNGWDCPYWEKGGGCCLENPRECEDYANVEDFFANITNDEEEDI